MSNKRSKDNEEIEKVSDLSREEFFSWFWTSATQSIDETFVRGQWDFIIHIQ